jgi:hypothetical protein
MNKETVLFALIRSVICRETVSEEIKTACTARMLEDVYSLAAKHDLAHLVGQAVSKLDLPASEALTRCKHHAMQAVYRYVQLEHAYQQVCQVLEKAQLPFLPLKGAVLRGYYPEPWMRTSCDVDILVQEARLDAAAKVLQETLGYRLAGKTGHDVTYVSAEGMHVELHFDLVEDGRANAAAQVLSQVWQDARPRPGYAYWCEMGDALFYFYHIAHMAKHFETGGCGIRPFIDLWLLDSLPTADPQARDALLEAGQLLQFAQAVRKLSRVWLGGESEDSLSVRLQSFLLHGGAYGTAENRVALQQESRGGKWAYLLSRIFAPYEKLKSYYPILEKHRWLMPVMQVRRWFMLLRPDVARRARTEVSTGSKHTPKEDAVGSLLCDLGIENSKW